MQSLNVPQLAWFEPSELKLAVPDDWQIQICNIQDYQRKPLSGGR
jgi:hypothetical protein